MEKDNGFIHGDSGSVLISREGWGDLTWKTIKVAIMFALLLSGTAWANPSDPPGAINPDVTQSNLSQTVCVPNWTKTVRPPVSYTNKLKLEQMKALGLTGKPSDFEEDHELDLACGGAPRDPNNLHPQSWVGDYGAKTKDVLESLEHRRLCKGEITLAQCQAIFLAPHDWRDTYDQIYGKRGPH